jgi:hypothetical protein
VLRRRARQSKTLGGQLRHFLVIAISWGAIQFEAVAPAYAADVICPQQTLEETSRNEQRRIVLSATAQRQADCSYRNKKIPSLEGLVQDKVLNWWVLHSPDEDYRAITTIAERNQEVLGEAHLKRSKDDDFREFSFLDVDLEALLKAFSYVCYDSLRSANVPRIYVSALQQFKGTVQESCLGLAVILAAQGISLKKDGEYIVPSVAP